ncbi:hypothetical protein RJ639_008258 [Escallonia herrerae]|uniref:Uncharacterized protein n=1 Tax=Escallonia herrerae TaxID=1293975 RepID=A0AA88VWN4_9ASTE|nr:hypothetical protein RJ639_008258 [Escallonia herrerae]
MPGEEKAKPAGVWPTVKPFLNGGVSGMLATCIIQPIDMIKVRIQLGQGSAGQVTRTMLKNEGIGAFYKSSHFGVALVYKALSIMSVWGRTCRTSACAFSIIFGFFTNSAIAHSIVVAVVSVPAETMS